MATCSRLLAALLDTPALLLLVACCAVVEVPAGGAELTEPCSMSRQIEQDGGLAGGAPRP